MQMKRVHSIPGSRQGAITAHQRKQKPGFRAHFASENAFSFGLRYGRGGCDAGRLRAQAGALHLKPESRSAAGVDERDRVHPYVSLALSAMMGANRHAALVRYPRRPGTPSPLRVQGQQRGRRHRAAGACGGP
jgi:hypothetical protein